MPIIKKFRPKGRNRTLTLVLLKKCNLHCTYCYEKDDYRDDKIMDFSVAQKIISSNLEEENDFDAVEIHLFGGEPMLCFPLVRQIVEWVSSKKWTKPYRFLIGTNGTILTDDIKKWLLKYRKVINVALSIDGNRTAHNITRDGSYDAVFPNISFFKENWPSQPAKMTVIGATVPYVADSIIELEEMGMNFTANIAFENFWGDDENKKKLLGIYEEQLARLVEYYLDKPHLSPVSPMLTSVPEYLGLPGTLMEKTDENDCLRYCGAGHEMVTVDVDGRLYPCHRFVPWVTQSPLTEIPTNQQTNWNPIQCRECKLVPSCPTCAGFNWEVNKDTSIRTTYHCEAYKLEVKASCLLEAKRLVQRYSDLTHRSVKEKAEMKKNLDAILAFIDEGI